MSASPIEQAIRHVCEEKGLTYESVLDAVQLALAAAYRKDFGDKHQNIEAVFDPVTGDTQVFDVKTVVPDMDLEEMAREEEARKLRLEETAKKIEEARARGEEIPAAEFGEDVEGPRFNPKTDMMLSEARGIQPGIELGEVLRRPLPPPEAFGRMAAMTAKQVIMQKLREAEREIVFQEFKDKEGEILQVTVQRREGRMVFVDIGRTTAMIRPEDQISSERYAPGDRLKVFVRQVSLGMRGAEILVSRSAEELAKRLFETEIPEVTDGAVKIMGVAREPGSRAKVAVHAESNTIDPIGACIGQRGSRIQTIISALGGEKIDLIEWSEDAKLFITHALSPAKVQEITLNDEEHTAYVTVAEDQLSLAIGRGGQNVRLAAHLTGWRITINGGAKEEKAEEAVAPSEAVPGAPSEEVGETPTAPESEKVTIEEGTTADAPATEAAPASTEDMPTSPTESAVQDAPAEETHASEEQAAA